MENQDSSSAAVAQCGRNKTSDRDREKELETERDRCGCVVVMSPVIHWGFPRLSDCPVQSSLTCFHLYDYYIEAIDCCWAKGVAGALKTAKISSNASEWVCVRSCQWVQQKHQKVEDNRKPDWDYGAGWCWTASPFYTPDQLDYWLHGFFLLSPCISCMSPSN